jgi:hypothetical protein
MTLIIHEHILNSFQNKVSHIDTELWYINKKIKKEEAHNADTSVEVCYK